MTKEVVVVVNANTQQGFEGFVIIDSSLNAQGATLRVLFSNQDGAPAHVTATTTGTTVIHEVDGSLSNGPARVIRVSVRPMEILIFGSQ